MATVTLTLRGDQLGTYSSLSANGNNAGRKVNLTDVEALGASSKIFTVVVEQVNSGVTEFQNGQFVTILDSSGNVVMLRTSINPDAEQGMAAGDEHLIIVNSNFIIDLGGVPVGPASVRYDRDDQAAVAGEGDDDGELDFSEFPCFGLGTLIEAATGQVPVENLCPGDFVKTVGGYLGRVIWVGRREIALNAETNKQRPILCRKGSLGVDIPRRDLILSPQHRLCVGGAVVKDLFGDERVLAPAKGLTALRGGRWMKGKKTITYVSILLDTHAVMYAEGVPAESLYPGKQALKTLGPVLREELYALIPNLKEQGVEAYAPPALPLITVRSAAKLVRRLAQSAAPQPDVEQNFAIQSR
ncbi:Hint domain-containing protein [Yoonia maritima]|uniref:Hint domain-containing protein n=1 Tax=Yoonia maritima TaxID=1435347 RepID=A0A2T0W4K8_9RHOB|nr:Hint domain-containing protein [Yoonia maritima]PRY80311.1 Hint domain-containing protein [Yoonia maritima]